MNLTGRRESRNVEDRHGKKAGVSIGTSAQRSTWLHKGIKTGNVKLGDTYTPAYNTL